MTAPPAAIIRPFVTLSRSRLTDSWVHGLTLPNCEVMLQLLTNDRIILIAAILYRYAQPYWGK
jgi:hypothetical protein